MPTSTRFERLLNRVLNREGVIKAAQECVLEFTIFFEPDENENEAWWEVRHKHIRLEQSIKQVVTEVGGGACTVERVSYIPGSITVLVVIAFAVEMVSKYKSLVENLELMAAQIKKLLATWGNKSHNVKHSIHLPKQTSTPEAPRGSSLVTRYLVISHALMLVTLLYLLLRKLHVFGSQ